MNKAVRRADQWWPSIYILTVNNCPLKTTGFPLLRHHQTMHSILFPVQIYSDEIFMWSENVHFLWGRINIDLTFFSFKASIYQMQSGLDKTRSKFCLTIFSRMKFKSGVYSVLQIYSVIDHGMKGLIILGCDQDNLSINFFFSSVLQFTWKFYLKFLNFKFAQVNEQNIFDVSL